ncbi:MAG: ATP-binding protein [Flavobacteriales bacterium]|nr:ATP-binding protein [Flavobacteriales bacterium]
MAHVEPIRIAITGPESSGKTTLTKALSVHYDVPWVSEMAREFLSRTQGNYAEHDLVRIARAQLEEERRVSLDLKGRAPILLCDTDMITIRIWGQEKFGEAAPEVEAFVQNNPYDLSLLCRPDMPWEADPLRENPHDRDRLFDLYEKALRELQRPYSLIEGPHEQRVGAALAAIGSMLKDRPMR